MQCLLSCMISVDTVAGVLMLIAEVVINKEKEKAGGRSELGKEEESEAEVACSA